MQKVKIRIWWVLSDCKLQSRFSERTDIFIKKGFWNLLFYPFESLLLTSSFKYWNSIRQDKIWQEICTEKCSVLTKIRKTLILPEILENPQRVLFLNEDLKITPSSWDVLSVKRMLHSTFLEKLKNRSSKNRVENNLGICQNKVCTFLLKGQ